MTLRCAVRATGGRDLKFFVIVCLLIFRVNLWGDDGIDIWAHV